MNTNRTWTIDFEGKRAIHSNGTEITFNTKNQAVDITNLPSPVNTASIKDVMKSGTLAYLRALSSRPKPGVHKKRTTLSLSKT